jgi:plasmid stabilization system protein ParE
MAAQHFYPPHAEQYLNDIADYLLTDNLEVALRFIDLANERTGVGKWMEENL